jgi:hypothetical protein
MFLCPLILFRAVLPKPKHEEKGIFMRAIAVIFVMARAERYPVYHF